MFVGADNHWKRGSMVEKTSIIFYIELGGKQQTGRNERGKVESGKKRNGGSNKTKVVCYVMLDS